MNPYQQLIDNLTIYINRDIKFLVDNIDLITEKDKAWKLQAIANMTNIREALSTGNIDAGETDA